MWKAGLFLIALVTAGSCKQSADPGGRVADTKVAHTEVSKPAVKEPGVETPVRDSEAAELFAEFGLPECSTAARLRDVRSDGYSVESWRVGGPEACFASWADRQRSYSTLTHLDASQSERDVLPWRCGETGSHVAGCVSERTGVTLIIEQPRFAEFLLLRRVTKVSE
jgi:hypothetical protein